MLSRNQERFLQALTLGKSIADSAKHAKVTERTAYNWLKDPVIQSEREVREAAAAKAEQAEIERILTSGYALMHKRVEALDRMTREIEASYHNPETGKIIYQWMSPDKIKEWRGCLDDIARELGQRIKKQEIEHSGLVELLNAEHAGLLADLENLPDAGQSQKPDTGAGADSVPPGA